MGAEQSSGTGRSWARRIRGGGGGTTLMLLGGCAPYVSLKESRTSVGHTLTQQPPRESKVSPHLQEQPGRGTPAHGSCQGTSDLNLQPQRIGLASGFEHKLPGGNCAISTGCAA